MYSTISPDAVQDGIQWVLWAVMAVFFVLAILSWWVASREWGKDEQAASGAGEPEERGDAGQA